VGGRCQSVELDGYRFDTGPSLLLFKHVYERTFRQLGSRLQDHVDVRRVEPAAYRWAEAPAHRQAVLVDMPCMATATHVHHMCTTCSMEQLTMYIDNHG
jgi:phytoene dehydrogenase-like protein